MMRQAAALAAALAVAFALGCGSDNDAPTTPVVGTKTVAITAGQGSGRVTSSNNKIDCRFTNGAASGTCSAAFDSGSTATLTATPDAGNEFVAWSGDCTGATCQLSVTRDVTASPRFVATQAELTVELTTPNADDGAILFVVSGPSVLAVTPARRRGDARESHDGEWNDDEHDPVAWQPRERRGREGRRPRPGSRWHVHGADGPGSHARERRLLSTDGSERVSGDVASLSRAALDMRYGALHLRGALAPQP
jgi:hypothetical protein